MSEYQSISIKEAMSNIASNYYLLPAIQRKFVWSMEQIEMLFDSILRGYPINSFMLWKITSNEIKQNYKFYQFIKDYVQWFGESNPDAPSRLLFSDFCAIIDGQQRLTSLYIGLIGSYKIKKANKWWKNTEDNTPMDKKKLYLEISSELSSSIDNEKRYNFLFLTDDELNLDLNKNPNHFWFPVGKVLEFSELSKVNDYLRENNLFMNEFSMRALTNLFSKLNIEKLINYYIVNEQDQDKVMEIFIRTNSGGTPLTFSDLLMSIASANWTKFDARIELDNIRKQIYSYGYPNFCVSQDFILKSILVLSDVDVQFKIRNFSKSNVAVFEEKWDKIRKSIITTFQLLEQLNFNDTILKSKNATIPIAYYIYKNSLWDSITKSTYNQEDKKTISRWLTLSLIKGIFGGTSDSVLKEIRDIISKSSFQIFPAEQIYEKYKDDPKKNYMFGDDIINNLLEEQWGSSNCSLILNLIYSDVVLQHGKSVAQDHMHPKSFFESKSKLSSISLTDEQLKFYMDKANYNSCLNLQLLETLQNESKLETPLKQWAEFNGKTNKELFVENGINLDIESFESFIKSRKKVLSKKLKQILSV